MKDAVESVCRVEEATGQLKMHDVLNMAVGRYETVFSDQWHPVREDFGFTDCAEGVPTINADFDAKLSQLVNVEVLKIAIQLAFTCPCDSLSKILEVGWYFYKLADRLTSKDVLKFKHQICVIKLDDDLQSPWLSK